jgi:carbamoyltransferase
MTILGFNPHHHGSVCLLEEGELKFFIQEERVTRIKYDPFPFKSFLSLIQQNDVNCITWASPSLLHHITNHQRYPYWHILATKYNKSTKFIDNSNSHHVAHIAQSFYNSGFQEAIGIVIDGVGSLIDNKGQETETIFRCSYPSNFEVLYKNISNFDNYTINIGRAYETVTMHLGWSRDEAGKTMGLAPYGKLNSNLPPFFIHNQGNPDVLYADFKKQSPNPQQNETFINEEKNPQLKLPRDPREWHYDESKITDLEKDLAWKIQTDTQQIVGDYIEKAIKETGLKKVCCAGGYFLNCVANYYLKKRFPSVEFYFEPIANDSGTAVGAAKLLWHDLTQDEIIRPQKSLYYGPQYSNKKILKKISKYKNMFNSYKIPPEQVAKLISDRNIVTIFQGRSEAGPRALGNRSILYDPTDPNGKDFVNKVKKREWFRPFAGTVLLEKANEWFDMAGLEESPFMMYAMDVWPDKQEQIQAITHVDGTCRIQTVTEEQNPQYYKLIQEFEKITGVPILFNTSFNLAGDPLVETIEDALETMLKSEMKYMYVPELEMLLEKK